MTALWIMKLRVFARSSFFINYFKIIATNVKKIVLYYRRIFQRISDARGGSKIEDQRIMELFSERDEAALRETELKYGRLCRGIAYNILGNAEDAEECVNDTLLSVWNKIPETTPDNLKAFVCRIARNTALKKLEYYKAEKRSSAAVVSLTELEEIIPDNRSSSGISEESLSELISAFLRRQKPEVRKVCVWRYWYFDPVSDIAARYSFSESKVKSMLFHTRNKLRKFLMKEGIDI